MSSPLFILYGNGHMLNRGCEAILRSTVSILEEEFGQCRFVNAPPTWIDPEEYKHLGLNLIHAIPSPIRRWSTAWLAYQVRRRVLRRPPTAPFERMVDEAAATLSIGGDNYSLDYGWPVSFFETNEIVLKRLKPLVLWGASVGPFTKDHEFEKCAAEQLKRVTLILARESETVAYLAALGVQENVRAVSDPAFVLEPEPVILPEPQQRILQTPCIGLNISPLLARFRQGGDSWQDRAAACVRALLESVDLPVLLIPHVVTEGSNNDFHFMKGIAENLASFRNRLFLVGPQYAAPQLKWIIGQCSVFVGARTHATIAALSLGVPTVSIGYSMKARGINKDLFGHTDWLLPIDQLKRSSIAEAVERLLDKADDVRYHLATIMPAYKLRARAAAKYLREVLQNT